MKQLVLVGVVAGISALGFTSCAYDPYYSSSSSYGGYGDGYGYGGAGFSTTYFVSTGSSRWAYDPYAGAYYDYSRRCYYDPYLNGYYPIGYRPRYVYGSPHPHGWSSGRSHCDPPSNVRSYNLTNYRDRAGSYRSLGRPWSSNVRVNNTTIDHHPSSANRDQRSSYGDRSSSPRPTYDGRSSNNSGFSGDRSSGSKKTKYSQQRSGSSQQDTRNKDSSRFDGSSSRGGYTPTVSPRPSRDRSQQGGFDRSGGRSEPSRSAPQLENRGNKSDSERSRGNSDRGEEKKIRGLGQG